LLVEQAHGGGDVGHNAGDGAAKARDAVAGAGRDAVHPRGDGVQLAGGRGDVAGDDDHGVRQRRAERRRVRVRVYRQAREGGGELARLCRPEEEGVLRALERTRSEGCLLRPRSRVTR
jgi:hypothetical protein